MCCSTSPAARRSLAPECRRAPRSRVAHQADDGVRRVRRAAREDDRAVADGRRCRSARGRPKARACSSSRASAVSVDELLHGMIVQSGNDASIALAELVAGSEEAFVAKMNAEAARLGLDRHALHQRHRAVRVRSTTRPRRDLAQARRRADPRLPGVLPALLAEGIPLQQHHAAESQPAAVDRSLRRRHEDRPHRRRGLVPDRLGEARRAARPVRRAGRDLRRGARERERRSSSTRASRRSTRCSSTSPASR